MSSNAMAEACRKINDSPTLALQDCALVIVGDGTSGYCQTVMNAPASGHSFEAHGSLFSQIGM